jgi:hypothetical protein
VPDLICYDRRYIAENKIERASETAAPSECRLLEFCLCESVVGFCYFFSVFCYNLNRRL